MNKTFSTLSFLLFIGSSVLFAQEKRDSVMAYVEPEITEEQFFDFSTPKGFEFDSLRNIYLNISIGAGIQVMQLKNTNPINLYKGVNQEFFKTNNLELISRDTLKTSTGLIAYLVKSKFRTNDLDYIRYSVVCGDLNNSCWMHFTYPKDIDVLMEDEVKKSVQSIKPTRNEIKD